MGVARPVASTRIRRSLSRFCSCSSSRSSSRWSRSRRSGTRAGLRSLQSNAAEVERFQNAALRGWEAGAQGIAALDIGVRTLGLTALIGLGFTVLAFVPLLSFPLLLVALVLLLTPVIGAIVALLAVAPGVASLLDQPHLAARSAHVAIRLAFFVVVPALTAFVLHWDGGPLTC
jgi:hypothetical protein